MLPVAFKLELLLQLERSQVIPFLASLPAGAAVSDFAVWDAEHPAALAYRFGGGNSCRRVVAAGIERAP